MKGKTYILLIENYKERKIKIGRLGKLYFQKGIYVYIGSGKKNINGRIKRHFSDNKKIFWHIDYLLDRKTRIKDVWISSEEVECRMAKIFLEEGFSYIKNFGSSDCRCKSHLFLINTNRRKIIKILKKMKFKKIILT
uniref:GIY-YIG nuclease family protein n=1 Tax=candidate division WOR-3 bacterium TaxID=2052148 RepID=A0A7C4YHT2_UNCW3